VERRGSWFSGVARAFALALLAGCGGGAAGATTPTAATGTTHGEALPFIHDDFPKALAEAKRRNKPLFVDAWAPWCHSCQSLRAYVLTDPSLAPLSSAFVWLSVDTEKDVNAGWVARFPHEALPTLWILDPATERPLLKWAGTATAEELRALLGVAVSDAGGAGSPQLEATAAFVRGNQRLAAGDREGAEKEHRAALAAAGAGHPHRARIVEALVTGLSSRKEHERCAEVAAAEASSLAAGTSRASVLTVGLSCARAAKRTAELDRLLEAGVRDASARDASLLPDDRAALYEEVVAAKKSRGDAAGARALAEAWAAYVEGEAAKARTADARAALDPWRVSAALELGQPERAIPALEASERDFPADYNPPARLGRLYLELARLDDADAAAARAVARVYGPRAMRVHALRADIAKARGDRAGEISALEEALKRSEGATLTDGQRGVREGIAKRLEAARARAK
jgi:thioredoxin-like negative regulator of GroEL